MWGTREGRDHLRADRLLSVLMLLQSRGRMTARDLAQELEVSERTIYRDMEALGMAGVPVVAERGPGGGCALLEGYRTNLTGLSDPELRALFLSSLAGPLGALGLDKAGEAAMLKLTASLPAVQRAGIERVRQRIHLDSAQWFQRDEEVPHLQVLQEAVWQDRRVRLSYRRSDGVHVKRFVDAYALVAKGNIWYLVGSVAAQLRAYRVSRVQPARKDIRVYRVSRIHDAELTEETFVRPESFDLPAYWAEWCGQFEQSLPRYVVRLRFSYDALTAIPRIYGDDMMARVEFEGAPDREGRVVAHVTFQTAEMACGYVLGFGTLAEVLGPLELRERVREAAGRVLAQYAE